MKNVCFFCKKNSPGKTGIVKFSHSGFKISLFKNGLTCLECENKEFAKKFECYKYLFTHEKGRVIAVDWKSFCEEQVKGKESEVADLFVGLGIFSTFPVGNWEIVCDDHIPRNPKRYISTVYFIEFKDAVAYAKEAYRYAQYNWHIRKIIASFSKDQLKASGRI